MDKEIDCLRCGKCCKWTGCKFLKTLPDGKTECIRYYNRLGIKISSRIVCGWRKDSPFNFEGCPYNILDPNKPIMPDSDVEKFYRFRCKKF